MSPSAPSGLLTLPSASCGRLMSVPASSRPLTSLHGLMVTQMSPPCPLTVTASLRSLRMTLTSALVTYPPLPGHLAMPHRLLMSQMSPPCSRAVTASLN